VREAGRRATCICGVAAATALIGLTWIYGEMRIAQIDRMAADAPKTRVAVIQGNIEQSQKWEPAFQIATIENYSDCPCPPGRIGPILSSGRNRRRRFTFWLKCRRPGW